MKGIQFSRNKKLVVIENNESTRFYDMETGKGTSCPYAPYVRMCIY